MAVFLSQRWRQQPQGNVQIDWTNPLTEKLFFAYIPGNPKNLAAARYQVDREMVIAPNGVNNYRIGPAGKAAILQRIFSEKGVDSSGFTFGFPGQLSGVFATANIYLLADQSYYLYLNFSPDLASNSVFIESLIKNSSYTDIYSVSNPLSPDLFRQRTRVLSYQFAASQVPTAFLGVAQVMTGNTVWDGTLPVDFSLANIDVYGIGNTVIFSAGGFGWSKNLSATELAMMDENPWQVFRPITKTLYSFPNVFQYSRPQSDNLFILNWSREPASGTHASALDEITADASDYIFTQEREIVDILDLSSFPMPPAGMNIELNYAAASGVGGELVQLEVLQTSTVIKSATVPANSQGTIVISPDEWALVTAWPWSPTLRVTSK